MKIKTIKEIEVKTEFQGYPRKNALLFISLAVFGFTIFNRIFGGWTGFILSIYNSIYFYYYTLKKDSIFKYQYNYEILFSIFGI